MTDYKVLQEACAPVLFQPDEEETASIDEKQGNLMGNQTLARMKKRLRKPPQPEVMLTAILRTKHENGQLTIFLKK